VPILREHRVAQLEQRLAAGARWQEHGFVFTAREGQPLDGCRLNRQTKALLTAAGLPPLKFHSLRHSCATFLLVQGVAPRVVMDILGHSQISLTMNTYSHVIEQLQDGAAQEMSALLWADRKA
jgi:integrase